MRVSYFFFTKQRRHEKTKKDVVKILWNKNTCGKRYCFLLEFSSEAAKKKIPDHKSSLRQTKDAQTLQIAPYKSVAEILALMYCFFELQAIGSFSVHTHKT